MGGVKNEANARNGKTMSEHLQSAQYRMKMITVHLYYRMRRELSA